MSLISGFLDHTSNTNWLQLLHGLPLPDPFYSFTPTREVNSQLLMFGEHIWKKSKKKFFKIQVENKLLVLEKFIALEVVLGLHVHFSIRIPAIRTKISSPHIICPLFPTPPPTHPGTLQKCFFLSSIFHPKHFSSQVIREHIRKSLGPELQHVHVSTSFPDF